MIVNFDVLVLAQMCILQAEGKTTWLVGYSQAVRKKEGSIIEESSRRLFHNVYVREDAQGLTARRMAEPLTTKGERRFYSSKKGCPAILLFAV